IQQFSNDPKDQLKLTKALFRGLQTGGYKPVKFEREFAIQVLHQIADDTDAVVMKDCIDVISIAKLEGETKRVAAIAMNSTCPEFVRAAAIETLPKLDLATGISALTELLVDPKLSVSLREKVAVALAGNSKFPENQALVDSLRDIM